MAKWTNDKCGYCDNTAPNLERYECPECKRQGCVSCMPTGNDAPCDQCVYTKSLEQAMGIRSR